MDKPETNTPTASRIPPQGGSGTAAPRSRRSKGERRHYAKELVDLETRCGIALDLLRQATKCGETAAGVALTEAAIKLLEKVG